MIHYGGKVIDYLVAEKADKTPELKHCLSSSKWKEDELSSNIRVELLTNTSSSTVSSVRRSCLIRLVHKSKPGLEDLCRPCIGQLVLFVLNTQTAFCLHFLGASPLWFLCYLEIVLPFHSPPSKSICLVLVQYLRGANPDDPNTLLTSSQLTAVGVSLSTLSLASGCVCCRLFCFCLISLSFCRNSRSFWSL